jgi:nicotinate-nucleotide adenylyltransferase
LSRVLLFGGSFDPIHHGHLIVARHVAETLGVERSILIPSAVPPHKQDRALAGTADRLAMIAAAIENDAGFDVSDHEMLQAGPNYTLLTIRHFRATLAAETELCWLIGMDSLRELGTWYRAGELVDACTIVTAGRPGSTLPTAAELETHFTPDQAARLLNHVVAGPQIDIASTAIRARVRGGRSIRYLVPESVRRYIGERGLYREA